MSFILIQVPIVELSMSVFSKTCEYAMGIVFFIAHRTASGGKVGIKEIACSFLGWRNPA